MDRKCTENLFILDPNARESINILAAVMRYGLRIIRHKKLVFSYLLYVRIFPNAI
jgi:hypothetical protein